MKMEMKVLVIKAGGPVLPPPTPELQELETVVHDQLLSFCISSGETPKLMQDDNVKVAMMMIMTAVTTHQIKLSHFHQHTRSYLNMVNCGGDVR